MSALHFPLLQVEDVIDEILNLEEGLDASDNLKAYDQVNNMPSSVGRRFVHLLLSLLFYDLWFIYQLSTFTRPMFSKYTVIKSISLLLMLKFLYDVLYF